MSDDTWGDEPTTSAPPPDQRQVITPEEYVVGCCLLDDGASLTQALAAGLASTDLGEAHLAQIFSAAAHLSRSGTPVSDSTIIELLGGQAPVSTILRITDPSHLPTTAHFAHHLRHVIDEAERRRLLRAAKQVQEAIVARASPEEIRGLWPTAITRSQSSPALRRITLRDRPAEPVTRLFLAGKPIATPGNLMTLISRAKTGKTATLGAATAAIITAASGTATLSDNLGFTATNPNGHAVIVIDTEQSPFDAWTCYSRTMARAGTDQDPDWLYHYCLVGHTPEQLKQALDTIITQAKAKHTSIFCVILDGVADFVNSVNDEAECNGFVNWLRERTVAHDCPAICVIHSNEGVKTGDDGRGHLGKQLTRKAESNLLLRKTSDVTTITSEKQRKAPITEQDGIAFRWDDTQQRHVSCERQEGKPSAGRKRQHTIAEFMECIPAKTAKPLPGTQIHRLAATVSDIKINTFKDLLAAAAREGELERVFDEKAGYLYRRAV